MSRRAVALGALLAIAASGCDSTDNPSAGTAEQVTSTTTATEPASTVDAGTPAPDATTTTVTEPAPTTLPFEPAPIQWETLNEAVDVGTLSVPVDYSDPDGPQFELFLARYNALDQANKIGSLLVNPGGPGFGGAEMAQGAAQVFDRALRERFDIIGWDPRGTGESDPPIDCIDDYDTYFTSVDRTPPDAAGRQRAVDLAEQFADECLSRSGDILPHVGTNASARDIDTIRRALGEPQISFFGFSYGSELGALWATLFPDTVRAAVFDGAADPSVSHDEAILQQLRGFEAALDTFLAECSADETCAFHNEGDAEGAFDALMTQLDAVPVVGDPGRPPVNRDVAIGAAVLAMYSDAYWPSLAASLAAAVEGDGSGLLALWDSYYQHRADGTWGNELEAFQAITCADNEQRPTVEEADAQVAEQHEAAPRLVPADSVEGYTCTFFPPPGDPMIEIGSGPNVPIVVIGITGDPSTPLASSRAMAERLADGRLVSVDARQHTGYGVNRCVIDAVNAYLIDLAPPDATIEC